jgi:hypothetical protein
LPARAFLPAALFAAAIALGAGCGGDEESYSEDYRPLSRQIVALGEEVGRSVQGAQGQSDAEIERRFDALADELGGLRRKLAKLDPPDDLATLQAELVDAMKAAEDALRGIERAAAAGDPDAARESTIDLVRASEDLRDARRKLSEETR